MHNAPSFRRIFRCNDGGATYASCRPTLSDPCLGAHCGIQLEVRRRPLDAGSSRGAVIAVHQRRWAGPPTKWVFARWESARNQSTEAFLGGEFSSSEIARNRSARDSIRDSIGPRQHWTATCRWTGLVRHAGGCPRTGSTTHGFARNFVLLRTTGIVANHVLRRALRPF